MPDTPHGGNLRAVGLRYGVDEAALLDFSANINPLGPPPAVMAALAEIARDPQRLARYPDPTALPLRHVLALKLGIEPDHIAVGNGAAAVLQAAMRVCGAQRCVLPVPAFSEYRRIATALTLPVEPIAMRADWTLDVAAIESAISSETVLVLSNPHNPSGATLSHAEMAALIGRCEERGAAIVIDEAFVDYVPESAAMARALAYDRAIVVRSLTKFYSIPGVRLGYAVAKHARHMRDALPTWPIGEIDIAAATAALSSHEYERETIAVNARERSVLAGALAALKIVVFPSSTNYLLLELPIAIGAMDELLRTLVCKHAIVVRDCRDYDGMEERCVIRVAVRSAEENARLIGALGSYA